MKLFTAIVAANLAIIWIDAELIRASVISLPSVGTNVNYDFAAGTPQFVAAESAAGEAIIHSEVSFADNKYLFVKFESDIRSVQIDLRVRGDDLFALFEPVFISFDEEMWFELANGELSSPNRNTGIGYYNDDPDTYIFSWSFLPDSNFSLHGVRWTISPDLIKGANLPPSLDIEISFFASGAIWVVPEPSSILGVLIAAVAACSLRRRNDGFAATSRH